MFDLIDPRRWHKGKFRSFVMIGISVLMLCWHGRIDCQGTQIPDFVAVPPQSVLYHGSFESPDLRVWQTNAVPELVESDNGHALLVSTNDPLLFQFQSLLNIGAEIRVLSEMSHALLAIRQSLHGRYAATLNKSGTLTLWKEEDLVQRITIDDYNPSIWHKLELSAFGNTVRVAIDGEVAITFQDPMLLPAGGILFQNIGQSPILFDEFIIRVPASQLPATATATPMPTRTPAITRTPTSTPSNTATATITPPPTSTSTSTRPPDGNPTWQENIPPPTATSSQMSTLNDPGQSLQLLVSGEERLDSPTSNNEIRITSIVATATHLPASTITNGMKNAIGDQIDGSKESTIEPVFFTTNTPSVSLFNRDP